MAGMKLEISNLVLLVALIFVVVGLVLATLVFFKREENLSDEDRLHYKRAQLLWIGAASLSLVAIYAGSKEKHWKKGAGISLGVSTGSRSASLL